MNCVCIVRTLICFESVLIVFEHAEGVSDCKGAFGSISVSGKKKVWNPCSMLVNLTLLFTRSAASCTTVSQAEPQRSRTDAQ